MDWSFTESNFFFVVFLLSQDSRAIKLNHKIPWNKKGNIHLYILDIFGIVVRTCHYRIPHGVYKVCIAHTYTYSQSYSHSAIPQHSKHTIKYMLLSMYYVHRCLDMQWPLASHLIVLPVFVVVLQQHFCNII